MVVNCPKCGRTIQNQGALNAHMQTHKSNNPAGQKNFSYNGNRRNPESSSGNKERERVRSSGNFGALIFLLIVIGLLLFWVSPWFNKLEASGVLEAKGGRWLKPTVEVGVELKYAIADSLRTIRKVASPKYSESLKSDVIESVKSGLEFGDFKISGVEFGGLSKDLRVDTLIIVGEFDENLETITAKVGCKLNPDDIEGIPGGSVGSNGEVVLEHPLRDKITGKIEPGKKKGIKCYFPHEKITSALAKEINLKEVEMRLTYTLTPDFTLEVLGMKEEISENEKEKILRGDYDRIAKMRYITDVVAKMHFSDEEPLVLGDTKILGIQFENKNIRKNKVSLEGFYIALPESGLRIQQDKCGPLDVEEINGVIVWKMKDLYIKEINKQLNEEDGETDLYECEIKAPDELGSVFDIASLGHIKGKIVVTNTISKKQDVTIYKKDEPKKDEPILVEQTTPEENPTGV